MKRHALIVDGSRAVRMDLRANLSSAGFLVTACDSYAAAKKTLSSRAYSLAIIDVDLPNERALDLVREVRSSNHDERMYVVLLTNESALRSRVRGFAMGADICLNKPYNGAELVRRVHEMFASHDHPPASPPAPRSSRSMGRKILVVDDSPTYRDKLAAVLRQDHHNVTIAGSGDEAMALLNAGSFDAVVLDLIMPGMSGIDVCRKVRQEPAWDAMSLLVMTATDDARVKQEAFTAGADDLFVKSPELEMLKVRLRGLLRRERARATDDEPAISSSTAVADLHAFLKRATALGGEGHGPGSANYAHTHEHAALPSSKTRPVTSSSAEHQASGPMSMSPRTTRSPSFFPKVSPT